MIDKSDNSAIVKTGIAVVLLGIFSKVVYLLAEAYYNNLLIEFSASGAFGKLEAENIERLGHYLAATGMTLALIGIAYPMAKRAWSIKSVNDLPIFKKVLVFLATVAILFFSSYHGQTALMDHLVSKATNEMRHDAYYLNMLRSLIARGDVEHSGIVPPRKNNVLTFEDKLILAEIPLAVFDDTGLIHRMKRNATSALKGYARERAYQDKFAEHWGEYRRFQTALIPLWDNYKKAINDSAVALNKQDDEADRLHDAYKQGLKAAHKKYKQVNSAFSKGVAKRTNDYNIGVLHAYLSLYFENTSDYFNRLENYNNAMKELFGYVVRNPEQTWCNNGCPGDKAYLKQQATNIFIKQFKKATGGVAPGHSNFKAFKEDAGTIRSVLSKVPAKERLRFPSGAPALINQDSFIALYNYNVAVRLKDALSSTLGSQKTSIGHGLNADTFFSDPGVLAHVNTKVPAAFRDVPLMLDKDTFFNQHWSKRVDIRIDDEIAKYLPESAAIFSNDEWYERGNNAVKLMYIIPIALLFSAGLFLINAVLVAFEVIKLASRINNKSVHRARYRFIVIMLVLLFPMILPVNLTDNREAVDAYMNKLSDERPALHYAVNWLNHAEAGVYYSGYIVTALLPDDTSEKLDNKYGISR